MEFTKPQLDVGIATRNAAAASAFYRDLMGFEALPSISLGEMGTQARFRVGDHILKLYDFAKPPEACEGGTEKANGMRLLAFILDDLEAVLARFDAAGHRYNRMKLPDNAPYQVAFASDADGNALELVGLRKPAGDQLKTRLQVGLTVSDIARSRGFYGELLGFPEEPVMKLPASMGVVGNVRYGFIAGGTTIKFWSRGEGLPTQTGAPGRRTGIRLMTAWVGDVDAAHEELRSRGVEIKAAPYDLPGLARVMFAADPDGNWIELASPLK
jgi:catechol 2,3-dioxygenase-like lactoylglutathione lyase family enzyme